MAARLLRKTGEAIKHSPSALRRALTGGNRGSYQMALVQSQDPFKVGLSFNITYAGCEDLESVADEGLTLGSKQTDPVVARKVAEAAKQPRRRVMLVVNDSRLTVVDPQGQRGTVRIPLYRIAFAGSHPVHVNAFAFVERLRDSKRLVCHVMLCSSDHMARTIVRVVSKAFQNAFLEWNAQHKRRHLGARGKLGSSSGGGSFEEQADPDDIPKESEDDRSEAAKGDEGVSEEEKDRRALHRSFYRRSVVISKPELLATGALEVNPDDFNVEEAAEYADPLDQELPEDAK